ncbi:MAG: hypothetical protein GQ477_02795, partial [Nanohaloarchaea archaeon]|nr:hypothetical protein [Candidatus Nanohaloarchaea archaeon]
RLIVNGASEDTGKTINFYIDGNLADETGTWQSGAVLELDLSTNPNPNDPPILLHFLYGEITIDGISAPTGTLIEAWSNETLRGNMTTTEVGLYGTPEGNRLIMAGVNDENITFRAKGPDMDTYALSNKTIIFVAGAVENITLHFVSETIVPPPTITPPSSSSRSRGGGSSSFIPIDTTLNLSNQSNSTMNISFENSTQNISDQINLSDDDSGSDDDTADKPSGIPSGDDSGIEGGGSLFDTASSWGPGNDQDTSFITGLFLGESAPSPYVSVLVIVILALTLGYIIFLK